jgi:hypothetical protein
LAPSLGGEAAADCLPDRILRAGGGLARERLEFGEQRLDLRAAPH